MASGEFRLGLNEVQVGLFPGAVIHGAFGRLVGGHAAQLLTRGALIDPATALRVGLVDELCEASQCVPRALAVAREMCALPREPMLRTRDAGAPRPRANCSACPRHAERLTNASSGRWVRRCVIVPATQERLRKMFVRKK